MTQRYRTPDPRLHPHRGKLNITALVLVGSGVAGILLGSESLKVPAVVVTFVTFMMWVYLNGKVTPKPEDVYEYLAARAETDGYAEWLRSVERDFTTLWGLDPEKGFTEVTP